MMAYPNNYEDEPDREHDGVACKRCGRGGLSWTHTGTRWRLVDDKGFHTCKATADDFDVVDDG